MSGYLKEADDEYLVYKVFPFQVPEYEMQELQINPNFIPTPKAHSGSSFSFQVPLTERVM